jgi:hypothetical protein
MINLNDIYIKRDGQKVGKKAKKVQITFQELKKINEQKILKTPVIQTALEENRIDGICETWKKKNGFILTERPIIIAIFEDNDTKNNEYWLVDGQHKLNAAIKLCEDEDMNDQLDCVFINISNEDEMDDLFELLNKDSYKNKEKIRSDFFERKLMKELKIKLAEKYKECYVDKDNKKNHIMTLDNFLNEIMEYGIFNNKNNKNNKLDDILKKMDKCNDIFFKKANYLENLNNNKDLNFYKDEIEVLETYKNCMFLKNNNFRKSIVDYLLDDEFVAEHEYRYQREKISSHLKSDIWKKEFKSKAIGTCPVIFCENQIEKKAFICGHIISVSNGGINDLDNLRPICGDCNMKMSSTNWNEYEKNLIYEKRKHKCHVCKEKLKFEKCIFDKKYIYCKDCYKSESNSDSD